MVAIARVGASSHVVSGAPARSTPNLDAQMRTCRAQLADWVTCPSAKTPEGKAKIEQISARLDSIKSEIEKSDGHSPTAMAAEHVAQNGSTRQALYSDDGFSAPSQVGSHVDTYA